MKKYLNKLHYSKTLKLKDKVFKGFLSVLSAGYFIAIKIRNFLYNKNILQQHKLPAYVISIGNLTTGGTGKTPITIAIADYIKKQFNKNVAVLSHGYGGQLPVKKVNIISDGTIIYKNATLAGDEPYLIAAKLKNIPVLTGKNRIKSGKYAIENFNSQILLLDDGFQHIKLDRDLNILVIDCNKKFGNNLLLPAGPLREPVNEINRADMIIVVNKKPYNKDDENCCSNFIENLKEKFNKPIFPCNFKNGEIYNIKTMASLTHSQKAYSFTGIAQPEFFFNYLKEMKINLIHSKEYTDHYLYSRKDILKMMEEAQLFEADSIITTEKDAVKLLNIIDEIELEIPIFALKLEIDLDLNNLLDKLPL